MYLDFQCVHRRFVLLPVVYSLIVLGSLGVAAAPPDPFEARLTYARGSTTLTTSEENAKGTPPVYNPFSLMEGDFIHTASSATVEISFTGGTLVRLGPNTAVKLVRLDRMDVELNLNKGVLLAKVHFQKDRGQQFRVVTPSAVATVKGTEFVVEEKGAQAHIAVLDEGHVAVTAPGFKKEVIMHFNQETQVTRGLSPHDASVLDHMYPYKNQMADIRQRIKNVKKYWKALTLEQRQRIRAAWVKRNASLVPAPARRSRRSDQ